MPDASDHEVRLRAEQWDQPVADYLALAERYLAFQQPDSTYSFHDAGKGNRRVSPFRSFRPIHLTVLLGYVCVVE